LLPPISATILQICNPRLCTKTPFGARPTYRTISCPFVSPSDLCNRCIQLPYLPSRSLVIPVYFWHMIASRAWWSMSVHRRHNMAINSNSWHSVAQVWRPLELCQAEHWVQQQSNIGPVPSELFNSLTPHSDPPPISSSASQITVTHHVQLCIVVPIISKRWPSRAHYLHHVRLV
jgi:hypothetical protein